MIGRLAPGYKIEKRPTPSPLMLALSPVAALVITLIIGAVLFASLGKSPSEALYIFFLEPLTDPWSFEEVLVKTTPLALIAAGLCICYRANVWNIGAEGQLLAGAMLGAMLPVMAPEVGGPLLLPSMLLMGALGGAALAAIPAVLKVRAGASEILTSLMLVYVAQLLLDYLVRGPWRNPGGFNFPETRSFAEDAMLPLIGADRLNVGFIIAVIACFALAALVSRTLIGYRVRLLGVAPRAARFAGVDERRLTVSVLLLSGALAGLAGIMEAAGPIGQLRPEFSPGYGFTAIIVAFVGRLNPIGALLAAFVLSLTYIGGEAVQISIGVSDKVTRVFQGALLFAVLACDGLAHYRLRRLAPQPAPAPAAGAVKGEPAE